MNEPHLVLSAAAHYDVADQHWPRQYHSGKNLAEAKPPNPSEALAIAMARGEVLTGKDQLQEQ